MKVPLNFIIKAILTLAIIALPIAGFIINELFGENANDFMI